MPRILKMYAWILSDHGPDDEGVVGVVLPSGWAPLVGADLDRAESWRKYAQMTADSTGKQVRLVEFAGPPKMIGAVEPNDSSSDRAVVVRSGQSVGDAIMAHAEKTVFPTDAHICKPCLKGAHEHVVCSMLGCRCTVGKV
jgi:hypothetical protein